MTRTMAARLVAAAIVLAFILVAIRLRAAIIQPSGTGGTTSPGGTNGQVQYNNAGVFGGYGIGAGLGLSGGNIVATGATSGGLYNGLINVEDATYGAKGDGTTDDAAAIQAAENAACATTLNGTGGGSAHPSLYFPPGLYVHSLPLRLNCTPLEVFGANNSQGGSAAAFKQTYVGPSWFVQQTGITLTEGAALVGTGNSLTIPQSDTTEYLNLTEALYSPLVGGFTTNGVTALGAFDIEFWYKTPAAFPAATNSFLLSSEVGTPDPNAGTANGAFSFFTINSTKHLNVRFNLSGGSVVVDAGALSVSTIYDIAGDYDGTTCRVFLNGVLGGSGACSGTVVESSFETVTVPDVRSSFWPYGAAQPNFALPGAIDAIDFENQSVHTVNYVSAASKPVKGAHTMLIENFETTSVDSMQHATQGIAGQGADVYLPIMTGGGALNGNIHMHGLDLNAGGTSGGLSVFANKSEFDHINVSNADFYGLSFPGNDYENKVHHNSIQGIHSTYTVTPGVSCGICAGNGFAEGHIYDNQINNVGLVGDLVEGSATDTNTVTQSGASMRYGYVCTGQCIYTLPFDDLEIANTNMISVIFLKGNFAPSNIIGAQLTNKNGAPFVIVSGGNGPIIEGGEFASGDATAIPYLITTVNSPMSPIIYNNVAISGAVAQAAALSNHPEFFNTPGCDGLVTLSSGAGTFSASCISTASICNGVDLTTFANSVTTAAPANGSVAITGTGADKVRIACR